VAGLATTFGRGAMTNHWIDLKNSDCIFVIGANPAENHPASMLWMNKAIEERGAKLLVADPRLTRTGAKAHVYVPLRSGTDIAFLGGIINYALQKERYNREYVAHYTNASFLIHPDFKGPADLDGLFSGYNPETRSYDRSTWQYQLDENGEPKRDPTLEDPQCVFQLLKRHYARFTPEMVERICGTPQEKFLELADIFTATGEPGKAGTILYAMGQTQHTVGSQNVRSMAMLQLLLGNIGLPGGGVNALRGESNVQGSTDMAMLFHIIPAYMPTPSAKSHPNLEAYLDSRVKAAGKGYWKNTPKFLISLLKAWWGDNATEENDYAFDYLPKIDGNYSHITMFEAMLAGAIKGLWIMGENPAVSGPNARLERKAMANLDWMVIQEIFDTETCSFWRGPDMDAASVKTEVFVLPAADAMEKAGSIVTSGRMIQWRPKVAEAPGDAKEDIWILDRIYREVRALYEAEGGAFPDPILQLNWDYGSPPDVERVAAEINGYWTRDLSEGDVAVKKGDPLSSFGQLRDDGSTACGNWLYCGYMYPRDDGEGNILPSCKRRGTKDPGGLGVYPYWGWAWPANRRIIYNRASADADGEPWSPDRALIWWDGEQWTGYDVPDFAKTRAPDAAGGDDAFIMKPDGKGWLFGALNEGPFPEHYEPLESPVQNVMSSQQNNPVIKIWDSLQGEAIGDNVGSRDQFPIVATTYRLTEMWQAGGMTRWLPWLAEVQPEPFVEISRELAAEKGIKNGERVIVRSARGEVEMVALVTSRFKPFTVDGQVVHQVGFPWHYGWRGLATGATANDLTPHVGDGNTMIPEYKAFLVDIRRKGGRS